MAFATIFRFTLPFTESVIIIALVLLIRLIGPVFFERIRIPSIAGLLLSGTLKGGHGIYLFPQPQFREFYEQQH